MSKATPIHVLALGGSLRCASHTRALLRAAQATAPDGVEITLYRGPADIPPYPMMRASSVPTGRWLYDRGTATAVACWEHFARATEGAEVKRAPGVDAAKLGTLKRADGSGAITCNGHPLYTFEGDAAPGQTSGQELDDFGAGWYALSAAGDKIE